MKNDIYNKFWQDYTITMLRADITTLTTEIYEDESITPQKVDFDILDNTVLFGNKILFYELSDKQKSCFPDNSNLLTLEL